MKTSCALVVLVSLLLCESCFVETKQDVAQEFVEVGVSAPDGFIELNVVQEPLDKKIIDKDQTLVDDKPLLKKTTEEFVEEDDVALPEIYQEKLSVLPYLSANQNLAAVIKLEKPSLNENNEEFVEEEDVVLPQFFQDKVQVLPNPSAKKQLTDGIREVRPSLKETVKEFVTKDDFALTQDFQEEKQMLPNPVEHKQSLEGKKVSEPLVMIISEELASEAEAALLQMLEIKKVDASGPVNNVIVKEKTDLPVESSKEQLSEDMRVEEPTIKKAAEKSSAEDEEAVPKIFEDISSLARNQQAFEEMRVEEPIFQIKDEYPASEYVVTLPSLLEMIIEKPSKPMGLVKIIQQAGEMMGSQMRLTRQVQLYAEPEEQLYNNDDGDYTKSTDLIDERAMKEYKRKETRNSI